jgi:hypothetical protein
MNTTIETRQPKMHHLPPPPPPKSKLHRWVAGSLAVLGLGVGIWWGLAINLGMLGRISAFERVPIPSTQVSITLDAGTNVLYVEAGRRAPAPAIRFSVIDPNGRAVAVRTYESDLRYDVPDEPARIGRAVATFEADNQGVYSIEVIGPKTDGAIVAIGDDVTGPSIATAIGALILISISTIGGLVLLGQWLARRQRRTWP